MKIAADRNVENDRLRDPSVAARVDKSATSQAIDPDRQIDFTRAVENSRSRRARGSLLRQLARLLLPTASDPSLYGNERSIELLQHVVDNVLPRLGTESDVTELAAQVLNEEIDQRLQWEEARRNAEAEESDR
ncbi:hypothetical protein SAMN05661010_02732 [Modicisalibacter muralis]|uniref:Uncharacterized protein n=1 Tax=Modicisalibacter muralis TaxID=119000 RepID=A0A1G9NKA4_9GAMM|nr:hypothetical protein [Halomonas muralis]SDL86457.1 hypothetical protein SAMN05661010_02732 [Halomonas muralis]